MAQAVKEVTMDKIHGAAQAKVLIISAADVMVAEAVAQAQVGHLVQAMVQQEL